MKAAFEKYDVDGGGTVDQQELLDVITQVMARARVRVRGSAQGLGQGVLPEPLRITALQSAMGMFAPLSPDVSPTSASCRACRTPSPLQHRDVRSPRCQRCPLKTL